MIKILIYITGLICCLSASPKVVEKTLAHINEEMISLMDLNSARKRIKKGFFDDSFLLSIFKKTDLQKNNKILLEFLIYQKILDHYAVKEQSLNITPALIQKEINKKINNKKLSKKAFSRFLVQSSFTAKEYKNFLKKKLLRQIFIHRKLGEKVKISDTNLNEFALKKERKALFTSFKYDLAYLLFPLNSEGKKRAQQIFLAIQKKPEIFDTWSPQNPSDQKSEFKEIALSSMNKQTQIAIQSLSVGQVSKVLPLSNGYHIFKVLWKNPIITKQNQKRKEKLTKQLFHKLLKKTFNLWITEKKQVLFIQKNK